MPDSGGEGQEALGDAGEYSGRGPAAVVFEVELAFEGLVDRLNPLADSAEVAVAVGLVFAVPAEQGRPMASVIWLNSAPAKPLSASRICPVRMR